MRLYRHYKQKYYKLRGLVRHSETREELALYDTMYESPGGREWVRPKEMFFGEAEVDGKLVTRFAPAAITIESAENAASSGFAFALPLIRQLFGVDTAKDAEIRSTKPGFLSLVAICDGRPVAFKIGYEEDSVAYYSWLGGTLPEFRGVGLATELQRAQEAWCRERGYSRLRTKSRNEFRDMIRLNLQNGFEIVGVEARPAPGGIKILMEKALI